MSFNRTVGGLRHHAALDVNALQRERRAGELARHERGQIAAWWRAGNGRRASPGLSEEGTIFPTVVRDAEPTRRSVTSKRMDSLHVASLRFAKILADVKQRRRGDL